MPKPLSGDRLPRCQRGRPLVHLPSGLEGLVESLRAEALARGETLGRVAAEKLIIGIEAARLGWRVEWKEVWEVCPPEESLAASRQAPSGKEGGYESR